MAAAVLHPRDLAGCEHRVALDFSHPDLVRDRADTPEAARRKESAQLRRERIRDFLLGLHSGEPSNTFVVVDDGPHAQRVAATREACSSGARWIWNATLPTDREHGRRGHSELLLRVGEPDDAASGYIPIIVVNHRVTYPAKNPRLHTGEVPTLVSSPLWGWIPAPDPFRSPRSNRRDQLRLAHLTQMLLDEGLSPDVEEDELRAGVIGLDADCIVVHRVGTSLPDYREVFDRRQHVAAGDIATTPRRIGECRGCPWWGRCGPELEERRDVSLVANGNQGDALRAVGITTIDQLARYDGDPPADWPANQSFDDAVICAIAWLADIPLIRRVEEPTVARADVEVDVDMESFGEDGAYLWGTLLTDNTDPARDVVYRGFATWTPLPTADEGRAFAEFWTWLMAERADAHAAGKTFAAYCYSQQAENRWLRASADRFGDEPGMPTRAEVEQFIASDEWVDIFEAVGRNFVAPNGKGLKRVAPVAGFVWRDAEAGGEASMDWYRRAVGIGGVDVDLSQRDRLLEYNEDDVLATKALREWMDGSAVGDMDGSAVGELPFADDLLAFRRSGASRAESVEERTASE